ncbi:DUF202 domain-containing protein [Halobacillus fulvus]|nr:DUF202 domain-containing protein [Halobacillus fulvus]
MKDDKKEEQKLIQQHLANERTYLAWIRTAIALIGIGFLATTLHVNAGSQNGFLENQLAVLISVISLILGALTMVVATSNYFRMRRSINEKRFVSSHKIILFMTGVVVFLAVLVSVYLLSV